MGSKWVFLWFGVTLGVTFGVTRKNEMFNLV